MRTLDCLLRVALVGAGLMAAMPAFALDGSKTDGSIGPPPMTPVEAFRSGAHWLKAGDTVKAVNSLEYAAEKGHALAQWKLGRMYAEGDGVAQNDLKAFEYFRSIANSHADDNPDLAAGALRRERLRRARPLLSRGNSEDGDQARPAARA